MVFFFFFGFLSKCWPCPYDAYVKNVFLQKKKNNYVRFKVKLFGISEVAAGTRISHMDVMSTDIESVENDILQDTHIESLRLMSNKIGIVSERAFAWVQLITNTRNA